MSSPLVEGGTVGIELGIKVLATTSEGEEFENQKPYHLYWLHRTSVRERGTLKLSSPTPPLSGLGGIQL